ncbi:MAG: alpha/beta hydrolase [Rubrobacter sp.]
MRLAVLLFVIVSGLLLAGCGSGGQEEQGGGDGGEAPSSGSSQVGSGVSGQRVEVGGTEALLWGEGDYGVVLSHGSVYDAASWRPQAEKIAENSMAALAVEDASTESLAAAARHLKEERGVSEVAFIGASAGAGTVLDLAREREDLVDQMILLSGSGDAAGLGGYPKLFVASEDEGLADTVRQMTQEAPGENNKVLILPGDAHAQAIFDSDQGDRLTQAILKRLQRYGGAG